jgi:hypothetical protein
MTCGLEWSYPYHKLYFLVGKSYKIAVDMQIVPAQVDSGYCRLGWLIQPNPVEDQLQRIFCPRNVSSTNVPSTAA